MRLNNTFLNNQQVTEKIKREIKKFLEINDNENTTQNQWDAAKALLRGKCIAIQSYLKKQDKHRIDNLTLHLNKASGKEKEEQQQISEEIKREIKNFLGTNDNENTKTQNLLDAAKAVLRGKFIAIKSYLRKEEKSQMNKLILFLKK